MGATKVESKVNFNKSAVKPNHALVVYKPKLNQHTLGKTYADAFDHINLAPGRYSKEYIDNMYRDFAKEYHPDVTRAQGSNEAYAKMKISFDGVRKFSNSNLFVIEDPISMTRNQKYFNLGVNCATTSALFLIPMPFEMRDEYNKYGSVDYGYYGRQAMDTVAFASAFPIMNNFAGASLALDHKMASNYVFANIMLAGVKTMPENQWPYGVAASSVSAGAFLSTIYTVNLLTKSVGIKSGFGTSAFAFVVADRVNKHALEFMQNYAQDPAVYDFMNSGATKASTKVIVPMLDWMTISYGCKTFLGAGAKHVPVVGTYIQSAATALNSGSYLTSGDPIATSYGAWNVWKQGSTFFVSATIGTGATALSAPTGPFAPVIGVGSYVGTDIAMRSAYNGFERATGMKEWFDNGLIKEPLSNIGITLNLTGSGQRPKEVVDYQETVDSGSTWSYISGREGVPEILNNGKQIKVNLQNELSALGIVSIKAENIKDVDPSMLLQVVKEVKAVNKNGKGKFEVTITYNKLVQSFKGEVAVYNINIADISDNEHITRFDVPITIPIGPNRGADISTLIEMAKMEKETGVSAEYFVSQQPPALFQVAKVMLNKGSFEMFEPNSETAAYFEQFQSALGELSYAKYNELMKDENIKSILSAIDAVEAVKKLKVIVSNGSYKEFVEALKDKNNLQAIYTLLSAYGVETTVNIEPQQMEPNMLTVNEQAPVQQKTQTISMIDFKTLERMNKEYFNFVLGLKDGTHVYEDLKKEFMVAMVYSGLNDRTLMEKLVDWWDSLNSRAPVSVLSSQVSQ